MDEVWRVVDQSGLGALLELDGDAVFVIDRTRKIVRCNEVLVNASGYGADELIGMGVETLIDARDLDAARRHFAVLLEGRAMRLVTRGRTKVGHTLQVEVTVAPVRSSTGEVVGALGVARKFRELRRRGVELATRLGAARLAGRAIAFAGWTYHVATKEITWSPELRELLGFRADDDVAVEIAPYLVNARDRHRLEREVQRSLRAERYFALTLPVRRVDGEVREFRILGESRRSGSGEMIFDGAVHDVTEVLAQERTLAEAERRVTETFNQLHVAIFLVGRDWRVRFANRAGEELLSLSTDELSRLTIWEWYAEARGNEAGALFHAAMEENRHGTVVEYVAGIQRWFEIVVYPYDEGILIAARDVTAEHSDQVQLLELAQRESYLAQMLNVARDAMVVREFARGTVFWNKAAEEMWGYSFADVRGATSLDFLYDDVDAVHTIYETVLREGSWNGEVPARHRDGRPLIIDATWQVVRNANGETIGLFGVNRDVTKLRQEHEQMVRAQRMESIGTLAGGIAHDLNNVLTPVMVAMEIVDRHLNDPNDRRLIEGALESLKRGATMIRQVLAFARGVEGERVNVDVESMLRDVVTLARMTVSKGIDVRLDVNDVVLPVLGDVTQLSQVFLNLITNARDAIGAQGHIHVRVFNAFAQRLAVSRVVDGQELLRDVAVVEVSDDGEGMDEATISKIFEPFFTTKALGVGSGLGLSTSLAIVRSHGGEITVVSSPGEGTTFRVVLPASRSVGASVDPEVVRATVRDEVKTTSRILVVDDEGAITSLLEEVLKGRGYDVHSLADGVQALGALRTHEYDVALVDLNMPELGGAELVRRIREVGSTMPVIFMSGYGDDGVDSANLPRRTYFLAKPFGIEQLVSLVETVRHPS